MIDDVGDQMPLKKEKFFEDLYESEKEMYSKSILKKEQEQIKQIMEKYCIQRLLKFEEIIKEQSNKSFKLLDDSPSLLKS